MSFNTNTIWSCQHTNDIYINNIYFCQQINIIGIYEYSGRINRCRHTIIDIPSLMSTYQRYPSSWYHLILLILIRQWLCWHTIVYVNIPKIFIFTISFKIVISDTWISLSTYQLRNIISYHYIMPMIFISELTILTVQFQYRHNTTNIYIPSV